MYSDVQPNRSGDFIGLGLSEAALLSNRPSPSNSNVPKFSSSIGCASSVLPPLISKGFLTYTKGTGKHGRKKKKNNRVLIRRLSLMSLTVLLTVLLSCLFLTLPWLRDPGDQKAKSLLLKLQFPFLISHPLLMTLKPFTSISVQHRTLLCAGVLELPKVPVLQLHKHELS